MIGLMNKLGKNQTVEIKKGSEKNSEPFLCNVSGMPVRFFTNDLNYKIVDGKNIRRPAHGQACSQLFHVKTGQ